MRRSTFTDHAVTYGAVGGTQAPDLMTYPPAGYRPIERRIRLGSGAERFRIATGQLMTWGVQRRAGMSITDIEQDTGEQYSGVGYDHEGNPVEPADRHVVEQTYDDDGTPYIVNGITARLRVRVGIFRSTSRVRVVVVVDEEDRVGFAYGTMPGHPLSGEESFVVEHLADNSVWLVLRAFSRPSSAWYGMLSPLLRMLQHRIHTRYLRALLPARSA